MCIILAYSYLSVVYSTPLMESHILARRPKSSYFNLKKNTNSSIYAVEFRDKSLNKVNCNLIQILISLTLMCRKCPLLRLASSPKPHLQTSHHYWRDCVQQPCLQTTRGLALSIFLIYAAYVSHEQQHHPGKPRITPRFPKPSYK
jgi:hypothetical protein